MENIEKLKFFRRQEEKWVKPDGVFKRILNVIKNPARAFWDILHRGDSVGPLLVLILNAITLGLWGLAIYAHLNITAIRGVGITYLNFWVGMVEPLSIFLVYFLFGLFYYLICFILWNFLFSMGANFSTNINEIIKKRYNTEEDKLSKEKKKIHKKAKGEVGDSLAPKKLGKQKIMIYAYAPLFVTNLIGVVILLIALPSVQIGNTSGWSQTNLSSAMNDIFASPLWAILDVLQILTLAIWIPITMSIALREVANTSTVKLLIGCVVVGIIISYMMFFLRPTLGWNFNIIAEYGNV